MSPPSIQLPEAGLQAQAERLQQDGVTVAVEWIDPERTREIFHAHLARHGIQPLLLRLHNGSADPYAFSKVGVGPSYLPAASAARWACPRPTVVAGRYVRWLVFLVPGVFFEAIIEPASTLEFPNMAAAAQRPAIPSCRAVRDDFLQHEIADAEIPPNGSLAGVLFIPSVPLGSAIPLRLVDVRTQQPLVFQVPTPPPVYSASQAYPQPPGLVWAAAMKAVGEIKSWRVVAADPKGGVITLRKGFRLLGWDTLRQITVTVQKAAEGQTLVSVESTLRRGDTAATGWHRPTIDRFFDVLVGFLPTPPKAASPVPAGRHPAQSLEGKQTSPVDHVAP